MIQMTVNAERAMIMYLREGNFPHGGCSDSATVGVLVQVSAPDLSDVRSIEHWKCEACGLDEHRDERSGHSDLADALRRLPPPPPGELDTDELAERILADIGISRAQAPRGAFGQMQR